MSSISSIGQSITPYLQGLGITPQASPPQTASSASTAQGADSDSTGSTQAVPGHHHHHRGGGGGGLFKQIQSAVSSALQSAQANGSSTDPNQVVQNAIAQVLKNHQNGQSATTNQASASETDPDGDSAAAGGTDSSAKSAFDQLLQANGVDPQQFQQDFLSAIQSAQSGGSTEAGSALASFPPGSVVDTVA